MQLEHIAFLVEYINGDLDDTSDDIITDSRLYDYICRVLEHIIHTGDCSLEEIADYVAKITEDYVEPMEGARERLNRALEIIVVTYYSTLLKRRATQLLENLGA